MADINLAALNNTTQIPQLMQQNQAAGNALKLQNLQQQSQANILATQVLSAATSTGNQALYDSAKQHLGTMGVDTSMWAPDVASGAQQAQAARLAQSPLGSLLNAGAKMDANQIAANTAAGKATTDPNATQYAMMRGNFVQQGGEPAGQMFDRAVQQGQVPGISMPQQQTTAQPQPRTAPPDLPPSAPGANIPALQQAAAAQTQAPPSNQKAIDANGSTATNFVPPPLDPSKTQAANQADRADALAAWKENSAVIQAQKNASELGTETAKQTGASAENTEMYNKLYQNLEALKKLNDGVPDSVGMSPDIKAYIEKRMGHGDAPGQLAQWDQINHSQILNGLAQLISQSAAGSSIRSNKTIVGLLETGQGIPADLPSDQRLALINNLEAELKNTQLASQNVKSNLTGQPEQPMNAIPVQKSSAAQEVQPPAAYKTNQIIQGRTGTYVFKGGDPTDKNNYQKVQ